MSRDFPDKVTPEEKARRRRVVQGWTHNLSEHDMRFPNQVMAYLKGYSDTPPPPYKDDDARP